jgi:purine nucleosidase
MADWIVDTDAGVDDAQALILGLSQPNFNIIGITIVAGNTSITNVYRNVSEVLRICNREDIPIFRGCSRPFVDQLVSGEDYHGPDGLRNYWTKTGRNPPERQDPSEPAAVAICRMLREKPGTSILALGPLTNIAAALLLDPNLPIGKLIVMGGTFNSMGNVGALIEFNFATDPEAAHIVFERAQNLIVVPFESCTPNELNSLFDHSTKWCNKTPKGQFLATILGLEESECPSGFCDEIAMAIAIDESISVSAHKRKVVIDTAGKHSRGQMVIYWDRDGFLKEKKLYEVENATIVEKIDTEKFFNLLCGSTSELHSS